MKIQFVAWNQPNTVAETTSYKEVPLTSSNQNPHPTQVHPSRYNNLPSLSVKHFFLRLGYFTTCLSKLKKCLPIGIFKTIRMAGYTSRFNKYSFKKKLFLRDSSHFTGYINLEGIIPSSKRITKDKIKFKKKIVDSLDIYYIIRILCKVSSWILGYGVGKGKNHSD